MLRKPSVTDIPIIYHSPADLKDPRYDKIAPLTEIAGVLQWEEALRGRTDPDRLKEMWSRGTSRPRPWVSLPSSINANRDHGLGHGHGSNHGHPHNRNHDDGAYDDPA